MSDYSELKRLAEAVLAMNYPWEHIVRDGRLCKTSTDYARIAHPSNVLALIAENERLKTLRSTIERDLAQELEVWRHGPSCWNCGDTGDVHDIVGEWRGKCDCCAAQLIDASQERDQLKAENEVLRKDKDRLDSLESNFWDVRHNSHPIADTGDSSSALEIVGHWMDKPFERVIGEDYSENLRAAIDQAMKAPAYPPARPEYEFDEIPDFGGGSGNKARRRAESMGIDYDAAMGKEARA